MRWNDLDLQPSAHTLRQFAGIWLSFFAFLGWWYGLRAQQPERAALLALAAVAVGLPGLWRPHRIKWLYVGLMLATFPPGWLTSRLVLAVIFYGVFTPLGLCFRLLGRDMLQLRSQPGRTTYWQARSAATDVRRYFRQF